MCNSMSLITFAKKLFEIVIIQGGKRKKTIILVFYDFRNDNLICENFNYDSASNYISIRNVKTISNGWSSEAHPKISSDWLGWVRISADTDFGMNRNKFDWFGMNFNPTLLPERVSKWFEKDSNFFLNSIFSTNFFLKT